MGTLPAKRLGRGLARPGQPPIIDCGNLKQLFRDCDPNFECLVLSIGCGFCVAVFVARSAFSRAVKNRFERSNPTTGTRPSLGKTPFQGLHIPYIGVLPIVIPAWRFEFRRGLWCPAHVPEVKDCRFVRFSAYRGERRGPCRRGGRVDPPASVGEVLHCALSPRGTI